MNLLLDIQNKKGEELATAMLRYLMLNSSNIRNAIIEVFSKNSPDGLVKINSHFSCYLERPTIKGEIPQGRIDMVIETDESVIGVETKLFSHFQDGQPQKYASTIRHIAKKIGEARGGQDMNCYIAVLAPEQRRSEVNKIIIKDNIYQFIAWEEILASLEAVNGLSAEFQFLLSEYVAYVNEYISFPKDFPIWISHAQREFEPNGTPIQWNFIRLISQFFPGSTKMGSGDEWVGSYFYPFEEHENWGWFGFLKGTRAVGSKDAHSILVVTTNWLPKALEGEIDQYLVKEDVKNSIGGMKKPHTWIINLESDEAWHAPETWRERLKPFLGR